MMGMIFNSTNLLVLIIICIISYTFWKPYIRGKKIKAVVDGYCHPADADDKDRDLVWCYRFMYRESKAGKRLYCYSRKHYDTKEEMRAKYPKGTEVEIRCYDDGREDKKAVIVGDKDEVKQSLLYTLAALMGGIGLAAGYQLLVYQIGLK